MHRQIPSCAHGPIPARTRLGHVRAKTSHFRVGLFIRLALVPAVWLGLPIVSVAQTTTAPSSTTDGQNAHHDETTPQRGTSPDTGLTEYPALRLSGFGNVDFAAQSKSEG